MTDQYSQEFQLLKALIEQIQKNNTNTNKKELEPLTILLLALFGLILCQKVIRYGHKAYKHYSAVNTRHPSDETSV